MMARQARPMASATGFVSPSRTPAANEPMRSTTLSPSVLNPNSFGSWLAMTMSAMPLR